MNTCDRCHVRAWAEWWRSEGQLALSFCRHHSNKYRAHLEATGWIEFTQVDDPADQPRVALTGDALDA